MIQRAAQITAVTRVDHRLVGDGAMGPVAARLRVLYQDVVRGRLAKYRHWVAPVFVRQAVPVGR